MYFLKCIYKNNLKKKPKRNIKTQINNEKKEKPNEQKLQINKLKPKNMGFLLKHSISLNSITVSSKKELVKLEMYKSVKIFCLGDTKK